MKKKLVTTPKFGVFIPTMQPGYFTPEQVMVAHGTTFADMKYDGYRAQIHKAKKKFKIFTRNGNELNYDCYPEIVQVVKSLPPCLIEAELIGEGGNHKKVFDNVKKRFRRPGIKQASIDNYLESGIIDSTPLSLRVFETLSFEGKNLMGLTLSERRKYTERFDEQGISPAETQKITSLEQLEKIIDGTFKYKQEGRVCKNPDSLYLPGKRTIDWVKFKRSEPLDLVVVGFYNEKGYNLDIPFTGVLCATYNEETGKYETMGKISTTRNGLAAEINQQIKGKTTQKQPKDVDFSEKLDLKSNRKFIPDWYINPKDSVVLQVKAMNLNYSNNWQSCGLNNGKAFSMRIGFADEVRYDKSSKQATTTQAVEQLYLAQEGKA